jgi:hypothetical protein
MKEKIFDNVEKLIPYNSEEIITDKIQSLIQELTPTMPNNVKELIPANKDIQITIEPPSNTFKYDTKKNSFKNKTVIAQKPSSPDGFVANYEALFANDQDKSEIKNSNNSTSYKSDDYDDFTEDAERIEYKKKKLFKIIDDAKKKIDNNLYIVSAKYDIIYFEGPAHKRKYIVGVQKININENCPNENKYIGYGIGSSHKEGEQQAAKMALIIYGILKEDQYTQSDIYYPKID